MSDIDKNSGSTTYGVTIPLHVYFDDLDPYGMMHHGHYLVMADRAWNTYALSLGFGAPDEVTPTHYLVKAASLVFDRPLTVVGENAVQIWTERVGRTSAVIGFRVCSKDGGTTFAHGTRTIIRISADTVLPTEWSDRHRTEFDRIKGPAGE